MSLIGGGGWLQGTMGAGDSNAYTTISAPPRAAGDIRTNGDKSNVHSQWVDMHPDGHYHNEPQQ